MMKDLVKPLGKRRIPPFTWSVEAIEYQGETLYRASEIGVRVGYTGSTEVVRSAQRSGAVRHISRVVILGRGGTPIPYLTVEGVYLAVMRARGEKADRSQKALASELRKRV